ncbi:transporter [Kitasatospora sp. NPDC091335]|uniref:transporter n=1 Tax=Kitasatospora sp. NPDC091335 TaxID=3364085 RepID=UPI00382540B9
MTHTDDDCHHDRWALGGEMTGLRLFRVGDGTAEEIVGSEVELERHLQSLIEQNMESMLGVRFLASEHSTGPVHGGRIDSLGLDEDGSPVVVEYKRSRSENVINQALFYSAWLRDHKAEFEALVARRFGAEAADGVDWSSPRIICVASGYSRYDVHAIGEMSRRIDLVRYQRFDGGMLALELYASVSSAPSSAARSDTDGTGRAAGGSGRRTVREAIERSSSALQQLYADLDARLLALGDGHSVELRQYIAYRHRTNFACVKVLPAADALLVFLRVDPKSIALEAGFSRDVTDIGHHGSGSLELRIASAKDLDRAAPLLQASYAAA